MSDTDFIDISKLEGFLSFLGTIDWRDPWLIGLFAFHLSVFMMAILTRNYGNFQAVLFFILLLLVYFSENINTLASTNWHIFSRQQYFDSNGLFISVVFSMPILINCMLMVGNWLYQSTQLMATLKQAQLKERLKKEKINREKSKND
ncbi:transmembrane protein 18 [Anthonomus grandis grandis]|uniref:transmembrane protein 18 n=1 Tax=Anthonomus grandis grandis TaxID=2921223 RepID=UPI0021663968|nr:transmembrane protein 18 [Anthonomus grandis grandis]